LIVVVRFGSYNLLDLYMKPDASGEQDRYQRVYEVIRTAQVDVLAVQELIADGEDKAALAGRRLFELAEAVGMRCDVRPNQPAVAVGTHRFHTGLLWADGIESTGRLGAYGAGNFWHSLARVDLDVGGQVVRHASFHATPFGRHMRADHSERVLSATLRQAPKGPNLIGGDWNSLSSDRINDGKDFYDPDPWTDQPWHPDFVFQCGWTYDATGQRIHQADRMPADVLYAGGFRDVAAELGAPWENTCGHWDGGADPLGARRLDRILGSADVLAALTGYEVIRTPLAEQASDHLPVVVSYDPTRIH
jgi:endonuclease/exonuclease/phosphatase family metal-dependent hydrolase